MREENFHEGGARFFSIIETRAKSSYVTCDKVGRAKSSYDMSSRKILRINTDLKGKSEA